jgi:hypothetical protein
MVRLCTLAARGRRSCATRCRALLTSLLRLQAEEKENVMKAIRIHKLVLNISVGESGDRLTKAAKARTRALRLALPWLAAWWLPRNVSAAPERRARCGGVALRWAALPRSMAAPASITPCKP